uniref:Wzz/FepE/Etk N-terminal domain-containing protein n=1 Tax=Klebsiella aerogenes TaxID=548 RepID=UPI001954116A
ILWRGKLWIAGTICLFMAAALTFLVLATPLYLSKTQLLIDPRAKRVLQTEVVPTGLGSSSQGDDTLLVDSQVEIIGSDAVLG